MSSYPNQPEPASSGSDRSSRLLAELRARIARDGPMPFAVFMAEALYHPDLGYYTAGSAPWSSEGDYLTAPQMDPALGIAIARLAAEVDAALGAPDPFDLVELGGGDGALLESVLETLTERHPATWSRTRVVSAERGKLARRLQRERLSPPPRGLRVVAELPGGEPGAPGPRQGAEFRGLVFCNELFDALPVHRVRCQDGALEEAWVESRDDGLAEVFAPPSTPDLAMYLDSAGVRLGEGQVAEICLAAATLLDRVAALLDQGGLLVIDYGHESESLYGPGRPAGTLVCQRRFVLSDDPLRDPGDQDITAHVDFGSLRTAAHARGFIGGDLCSLRVFIIGMGVVGDASTPRLGLRHLLVSEIGEAHKVLWLPRGRDAAVIPGARERLDRGPEARDSVLDSDE